METHVSLPSYKLLLLMHNFHSAFPFCVPLFLPIALVIDFRYWKKLLECWNFSITCFTPKNVSLRAKAMVLGETANLHLMTTLQ